MTRYYLVQKPHYTKLPPTFNAEGERVVEWAVDWETIGVARDMADAKAQFGGAPVLHLMSPEDSAVYAAWLDLQPHLTLN